MSRPRPGPAGEPERRPRTGARRASEGREVVAAPAAPAGPGPDAAGAKATHLGIRWQRQPSGLIRWWDSDIRRWTPYRPGDDAPPRPPGWERQGGPATDKASRAPWRSPYRLVPLGLTAILVIIGLFALHGSTGSQVGAEAQAATKLAGACLRQTGTDGGHPAYGSSPVPCTSRQAAVRVTEVLAGTPGAAGCPAGDTAFSLPYPGVRYPHVLCVAAVTGAR